MKARLPTRLALWLALVAAAGVWPGASACSVYEKLTMHADRTPGKDSGMPATDAGSMPGKDGSMPKDGAMCVPKPEICNGADDDCNGKADDGAAAQKDCEKRVLHAPVICQKGTCVLLSCDPGFASCDGHPENGCEARYCECNACDDGGTGDGGGGGGDAN